MPTAAILPAAGSALCRAASIYTRGGGPGRARRPLPLTARRRPPAGAARRGREAAASAAPPRSACQPPGPHRATFPPQYPTPSPVRRCWGSGCLRRRGGGREVLGVSVPASPWRGRSRGLISHPRRFAGVGVIAGRCDGVGCKAPFSIKRCGVSERAEAAARGVSPGRGWAAGRAPVMRGEGGCPHCAAPSGDPLRRR